MCSAFTLDMVLNDKIGIKGTIWEEEGATFGCIKAY